MVTYLTKEEVCKRLNIEEKTLYEYINYHNFPVIKLSPRKKLFCPLQIDAWLKSRAVNHINLKEDAA